MDVSYAESESSCITNYTKLRTCNSCQKPGHYAYECSSPNAVRHTAGNSNHQAAKKGPRRGSDAVAKGYTVTDSQKRSGSVVAEQTRQRQVNLHAS